MPYGGVTYAVLLGDICRTAGERALFPDSAYWVTNLRLQFEPGSMPEKRNGMLSYALRSAPIFVEPPMQTLPNLIRSRICEQPIQ